MTAYMLLAKRFAHHCDDLNFAKDLLHRLHCAFILPRSMSRTVDLDLILDATDAHASLATTYASL